ncbi:MAG: Gfo/Idh/MocA family oxidoreductase [Pirellulaceae bacterium]|nr:Gfo/Idh/MocA family oxidoreductase [Pirellulaceae bacterium]
MPLTSRRRDFLKAGTAFTACSLLSASAKAISPNGKLRTAHIGVGGKGAANLKSVASHDHVEVAALCDVDTQRLATASRGYTDAETFRDYRELLDRMADRIDAVVVSTPDHTHAPATMMAMNLGKPVYCEKPLTHDIYEARRLRLVSEKKSIVTQMGIQRHSAATSRRVVAMLRSGVIGKITRVFTWSFKNWGYDGAKLQGRHEAPETLDWNLWLGSAKLRPYHPDVYHPRNWRKLIDFGTGTLGDMGVHIFDTPYGALELTAPKWAKTTCRTPTGIGHPEQNVVEYEFSGTKHTTATLHWTWLDGAHAPPRAEDLQLPTGAVIPKQGSLCIGEAGSLLLPHVAREQLFPADRFRNYQPPTVAGDDHYHQWVNACLGMGETSADFSYGGPLTEALLLGVVANRFPGRKLAWDPKKLQITNLPEANKLIRRTYRKDFQVENL